MKRSSLDRMRAAVARVAPRLAPSSRTEPASAPPNSEPRHARYVDTGHRQKDRPNRVFIDDHCANCLAPLPVDEWGLYCSPLCKETAKDVRYIRRKERDPEQLEDPDILDAIHMRIAHLLGGGYDAKARRIAPGVRELVKARDEGKCVQCGEVGQEIDHVDGGSNEPGNLQLLCTPCHRAKTALRMKPTSDEQDDWIDELYRERINPEPPVYLADDEIRWALEWRALLAARRKRLEAAGYRKPAPRRREVMPETITLQFIPGQGVVTRDPADVQERSTVDHHPRGGSTPG